MAIHNDGEQIKPTFFFFWLVPVIPHTFLCASRREEAVCVRERLGGCYQRDRYMWFESRSGREEK